MSARPPLPAAAVALLACPACREPLSAAGEDGPLRCPAGHSFDRARHGQMALPVPGARLPEGDSAPMVADRVAFLSAGHYAGVTAALVDAVAAGGEPRAVLDLGGGTGHHLAAVLDRVPGAVGVVLDASRYAARRAARAHPRAVAVVADAWSRLPVRDGVVDRLVVAFAPRNGPEAARVLAPGGRLVVVTPAPDHLGELVGPMGLLRVDPDKPARLAATLGGALEQRASTAHREELLLDRTAVRALVGMGPHARHLDPAALDRALAGLAEPVRVTIAVDVSTWAARDP